MSKPKPNLFICGAPRAGTTSLYRYLKQHPNVCMTKRKETGVFLENYEKGLEWLVSNYLAHYEGESIVGEATTGHMQHPASARRMAEALPNTRLIFILRDPVERIYSHYRFHRQNGRLTAADSFSDLIRDEGAEWRRINLDNGMYYKHLTRYARHFDRAQMRIFLFRDLKADPGRTVRELYNFLGVDPTLTPDISQQYNSSGRHPRQEIVYRTLYRLWRPVRRRLGAGMLDATRSLRDRVRSWLMKEADHRGMAADDRAYLQAIYREPNRRLEEWLERDLTHWT